MQSQPLIDIVLNFKTKPCSISHPFSIIPDTCPYSHGESDLRRPHVNLHSQSLFYLAVLYVPGIMPSTQRYFFCQNLFEYNYHISNYKTKPCPYLEIADLCEMGKYCPYIHPGDSLDQIAKFRSGLNPPPAPFYSPISGLLESANGYIFPKEDASLVKGKRKARHSFTFPDGEDAYILGKNYLFLLSVLILLQPL